MHYRRVVLAFLLSIAFPFPALGADRQLEDAKHAHDVAVAKADADLQAAEKKCATEKQAADARLIKVYEEAIKRATQRGDLAAANQLLAEKNAIQTGSAGSGTTGEDKSGASNSKWIDGKKKWIPLSSDGAPTAIVINDVGDDDIASDYLKFLANPDESASFHGHEIMTIKADGEGMFKGPGPKNIQTNYYAIYLRVDSAETDRMQLRTTEFGSVKVYLDGRQLLDHQADKKNKYQATLPLPLSAGAHIIVIRHANEWAGDSVGVHILGRGIETANLVVH
jgi:hypothetical protein